MPDFLWLSVSLLPLSAFSFLFGSQEMLQIFKEATI